MPSLEELREDFPHATTNDPTPDAVGIDLFEDRPGFTAIYRRHADGLRYPCRDVDMSIPEHAASVLAAWTEGEDVHDFRPFADAIAKAKETGHAWTVRRKQDLPDGTIMGKFKLTARRYYKSDDQNCRTVAVVGPFHSDAGVSLCLEDHRTSPPRFVILQK